MRSTKENANAKINLFLDVLKKREDGFHDISTIMHSLDLHDVITVTVKDTCNNDIELNIENCTILECDKTNLVYRAAEMYMQKAEKNNDLALTLEKNIPMSAGLAGGSTDAAATLRALNRLFDNKLTEDEQLEICAKLGSDVPYCYIGGTALCSGRGEKMTKLPNNKRLFCVISIDNENISTPRAYKKLDELYSDFDGSKENKGKKYFDELKDYLNNGILPKDGLYNIFEEAAFDECKGAERLKGRMIELGAELSLMSGSGPSVFGIFKDDKTAKNAEEALKNENKRAFYCETV